MARCAHVRPPDRIDQRRSVPAAAAPDARADRQPDAQGLTRIRPELELLLCCARTELAADRAARAGALARLPLDWEWLIGQARRHGVDPLLYRHVSALGEGVAPAAALAQLKGHWDTNAVRNRLLTAELGKVLAQLAAAGIDALPYKGPVLAALAYGDLSLRRFADLDLLVRPEHVLPAVAALRPLGYQPRLRLTPAQERAYLASQCEYALDRDRGRLSVEIHWDVVPPDFAFRFDLARLWQTARPVAVDGLTVQVPEPEDLLLMLVVHGSKHLWERLAWLVDVLQVIDAHPELDWPRLLDQARERGGARMLRVALGLVLELLGGRVPPGVSQHVTGDRTARALVRQIVGRVSEGATPAPRSVAALRAYAALRERRRDKALCVLRTLLTPTIEDWASVRLPAALLPMHYLLRPLRLVAKRTVTRRRSDGGEGGH